MQGGQFGFANLPDCEDNVWLLVELLPGLLDIPRGWS